MKPRFSGREFVRGLVRERDKQTCNKCRKKWNGKGRHFHVHHLNGLCGKKSRGYDRVTDMDGLTTLCASCHALTHGRNGKKNGVLSGKIATMALMRIRGFSYDAIGRELGVSGYSVYHRLNY